MPAEWTRVDPPTYIVVAPSGRPLQDMPRGIKVYTDGSGCKNTNDSRLRRCGWAWVTPGITDHPDCGRGGNLLGQQILPSAELTALMEFVRELEIAPQIDEVDIYSGCKMVVDLFNGGIERCKMSRLWELWRDFWEPVERIRPRLVHFAIHKVKAHCDDEEIVPEVHRKGNNMADKYAGPAVVEVTTSGESRVRRLYRKVRLIQERLIQAIFLLPWASDLW